jgi:hypothetical protein
MGGGSHCGPLPGLYGLWEPRGCACHLSAVQSDQAGNASHGDHRSTDDHHHDAAIADPTAWS